MARATTKPERRSRRSGKEARRQQLINSTIASIAERGFSETTISHVAEGAHLSHGIVNFHFQSKELLLIETLRYLAEEYMEFWARAVDRAGPGPAEKLAALLLAQFHPVLCNGKKIAVWHAFYGEASSRPIYRKICGARDRQQQDTAMSLVRETITEGGYDHLVPEHAACGLNAMTDGLLLDRLLGTRRLPLADCRATILAHLAALFPNHFPLANVDGAVGGMVANGA